MIEETSELSQYVPGFVANLNLAPQQTDTKLLGAVMSDLSYGVKGEMFNADDVHETEPEDVQTRVADTPDKFIGATRRVGFFSEFHDSAWFDKVDEVKEITDPTSTKMASLMAGLNRKRDQRIYQAGLGNAFEKPDNTDTFTTVPLPAGQIIAANDVSYAHQDEVVPGAGADYGLGIGKLIHAGLLLDESEVEGERFLLYSSKQKADLLRTTPATNRFYTEVQALNAGKINQFLGFTFIQMATARMTRAVALSGAKRKCMAWVKPALVYKGRSITQASIAIRPDKSHTPQAYYKAQHGASRRYDKGVVEIDCTEV